jgi:hypothetical protein
LAERVSAPPDCPTLINFAERLRRVVPIPHERGTARQMIDKLARSILVIVAVILASLVAYGLWQPLRWRRERDAQCAAVRPWIERRASLEEIRRLPVGRPVDYSGGDAEFLIRAFGAESVQGTSIGQYLHQDGKAVLFHGSASFMLVYFDGNQRAFRADCFLQ